MAHSNKSYQARELKDGTMLILMFPPAYCCLLLFQLGFWLVVWLMLVSQFSNLYLTSDTSTKWVSPQSYIQSAVSSCEEPIVTPLWANKKLTSSHSWPRVGTACHVACHLAEVWITLYIELSIQILSLRDSRLGKASHGGPFGWHSLLTCQVAP